MQLTQIVLGMLAILLAWVLIFKKPLIFRLNAFMRERVFTDHLVLFSGGRIAFLLLVLGVVALFSGVDRVIRDQPLRPRTVKKIMELAHSDFTDKKYEAAIAKCHELLESNPANQAALELLLRCHRALGQKEQAHEVLKKILKINPRYTLSSTSNKK